MWQLLAHHLLAMRTELPRGTVTFLFTDVEGSTRLLHELGAERYAEALAEHRRVLRDAFSRHGGVEVDTQGDAFFVAFPTAEGAVRAAEQAQRALADGPIRARMGIHTGTPVLTAEGYVGADVHRAARVAAAGHGGQVLISAATAALVDRDALLDLGDHRLKDLSAAERLHQLGDHEFPPLKTLFQTNLPVPTTTFHGREREVGAVESLVRRPEVRVVTLTGPGGTGKTRLALQAAGSVGDAFDGGVWWAPLATIRDPELVIPEAARALGVKDDLAEYIADRSMLIVLDNFEQVAAAAGDLAQLLGRCPRLKVLVTSREALRIAGEWEYFVDPLREAEAVELFITRAMAARHDFAPTGDESEICLRLDHLPLAIELAAARIKVLSPRALLDRLQQRLPILAGGTRDAPERQRTLRATIMWSHELLNEDEQRLFARLSVFRGGWTLEAAESVADADLDTLGSLVDKSLVRQRDERYGMLETIREYALERLAASPEVEQIRRRHADHYLALAEAFEQPIRAGDHARGLAVIGSESDNLRAALDWLIAAADGEKAQRMGAALWRFWYLRGHLSEGSRRFDQLLPLDERPTPARAMSLAGASVMAFNLGRDGAAKRFIEEALSLYELLGDDAGIAYCLLMLGNLASAAGEHEPGRDLYARSVALFQKVRDHVMEGMARDNMANTVADLGDLEYARRLCQENVALASAHADAQLEAMALGTLGGIARREGRLEDALEHFQGALRYWHQAGIPQHLAREMAAVARVRASLGDARGAGQLLGRSMSLYDETGAVDSVQSEYDRETLALIREQVGEEGAREAIARGRDLALDDAVRLALERPSRHGSAGHRV